MFMPKPYCHHLLYASGIARMIGVCHCTQLFKKIGSDGDLSNFFCLFWSQTESS